MDKRVQTSSHCAVHNILGHRLGILTAVTLGLQAGFACWAQSTGPFIPASQAVIIKPQTNSLPVSVTLHVILPAPSPCYYITNWGQPLLQGNSVSVDAQFWESSLVACPTVLSGAETQYDLGSLPPGDYRFVFGAWGVTVKTQAFSVPVLLSIRNLQAASQIQLCWNTATNGWYRLECSSALATNEWAAFTAWLPGNGNPFCTNDAVMDGQPQKFFRVAGTIVPPLP